MDPYEEYRDQVAYEDLKDFCKEPFPVGKKRDRINITNDPYGIWIMMHIEKYQKEFMKQMMEFQKESINAMAVPIPKKKSKRGMQGKAGIPWQYGVLGIMWFNGLEWV